jgi:hypothetical protein
MLDDVYTLSLQLLIGFEASLGPKSGCGCLVDYKSNTGNGTSLDSFGGRE